MAVSQNACEFSQRCCSQAVNHRVFSRLDVTLWNRRLSKYQFRSKSVSKLVVSIRDLETRTTELTDREDLFVEA